MIPLAPCSSPRMKPTASTGVCLVPSASSLWNLSRELMQICRCSSTGYVTSNPGASCLLPASLKLAGSLSQSLATAQWLAHRGCLVNVGSSHRSPLWKPRQGLLFLRPSCQQASQCDPLPSFLLCRMVLWVLLVKKSFCFFDPQSFLHSSGSSPSYKFAGFTYYKSYHYVQYNPHLIPEDSFSWSSASLPSMRPVPQPPAVGRTFHLTVSPEPLCAMISASPSEIQRHFSPSHSLH